MHYQTMWRALHDALARRGKFLQPTLDLFLSLDSSLSRFSSMSPKRKSESSDEALKAEVAKEGDDVPQVVFKARVRDEKIGGENPFDWKDVTKDDLFKGKRVVLFALPGAFTPTCSSSHLPGYEEKYDEIKASGVDEIYCLSVNDAFVMRQWGLHQKLEEEGSDASNPLNPGNFKKVRQGTGRGLRAASVRARPFHSPRTLFSSPRSSSYRTVRRSSPVVWACHARGTRSAASASARGATVPSSMTARSRSCSSRAAP